MTDIMLPTGSQPIGIHLDPLNEDDFAELLPTLSLEIKRHLACDPATPVWVLTRFGGDSDWTVRAGVAGNRSTPVTVLGQLVGDSNWLVRRFVAGHSSTPPVLLEQLAGDIDSGVLWSLADNPNAPEPVLEHLANYSILHVREAARKTLDWPTDRT